MGYILSKYRKLNEINTLKAKPYKSFQIKKKKNLIIDLLELEDKNKVNK